MKAEISRETLVTLRNAMPSIIGQASELLAFVRATEAGRPEAVEWWKNEVENLQGLHNLLGKASRLILEIDEVPEVIQEDLPMQRE